MSRRAVPSLPAVPVLVVASLLARRHWLLRVAGAATVVATVAAAALGLTVAALGGSLEDSVWEHAGTPARWVLFVIGGMATATVLPAYLTHGLTRRTVTTATALAGVVLAAATALYLAGGLLVERAVAGATGWTYGFRAEHLFTGPGQVHLVVAEYGLVCAGYLLSGWLIGTAYYRYGGVGGALAILPGLLPAAAVEYLLGTGQWTGIGPPALGGLTTDLPIAAALGLAALVLALGSAALRALTRDVAIRTHRRRP